jgi:hypothetical protein
MVRIITFVLVSLYCVFLVQAETVSLSGVVYRTGTTTGLANVKISLAKVSKSTMTGGNGTFTLTGSTTAQLQIKKDQSLEFILKDNIIIFSPTFPTISGTMDIFSSDGKKKVAMRFTDLRAGRQSVTLPELNSGINILRLTIGGETHTRTLVCLGNSLFFKNELSEKSTSGNFILTKQTSTAIVDTLIAEKENYGIKKVPINSYNQQNIVMYLDTIGEPPPGGCTRANLQAAVDSYIEAQKAGDPTKMALASKVRYIENLDTITMDKSICKKALPIALHHDFLDCDSCRTFSEVIVTGGGHPYVIGMRLRVVDSKVTEVDAIVTDTGDWLFNAKRYLDTATVQTWDTLPVSERTSRQILINAADAYGAIFEVPHTDSIPFGSPCSRLEGGTPAVCTMGFPTGSTNHKLSHRDFVVDVDKGVIDMFCFLEVGGEIPPKPDSHLLKLIKGKIRYVHTLTIWDL